MDALTPPRWWQLQLSDGSTLEVLASTCETGPGTLTWWVDTIRSGTPEQLQVLALPADAVTARTETEESEEPLRLTGTETLFGIRAAGRVVPVAGASMLTRPDGSGAIGTGVEGGTWQVLVRSKDPVVRALALPAKPVWRVAQAETDVPEPRSEDVLVPA